MGTVATPVLPSARTRQLRAVAVEQLAAAYDPSYAFVRAASGRYRVSPAGTDWLVEPTASGVRFQLPSKSSTPLQPAAPSSLELRTTLVRCDGRALSLDASASPLVATNQVSFDLFPNAVREQWLNGPHGLEHVIELEHSVCPGGAEIEVEVAVSGMQVVQRGSERIAFREPGSIDRASYTNLLVEDAGQRELPAKLIADAAAIRIQVDVRGAAWPVRIDPLVVTLEAVLAARAGVPADDWGRSAAMHGMDLLIGAPHEPDVHPDQGSVYAYEGRRTAWGPVQRFVAPDGASGDAFGHALSVSLGTALVGAPGDDDAGADAGSVYVMTRPSSDEWAPWAHSFKLTASDAAPGDAFGQAVAIHGDVAWVGAPMKSVDGTEGRGVAYVFARSGDTWTEQHRLSPMTGSAGDGFGAAVAAHAGLVLIGAPKYDGAAVDSGAAWLFGGSDDTWEQLLFVEGNVAGGARGTSVSLATNWGFVGAPGEGEIGQGTVEVLARSEDGSAWSSWQTLTHADAESGDGFGYSVDVDDEAPDPHGAQAFIGAPFKRYDAWEETGAVYNLDPDSSGIWQVFDEEDPESDTAMAHHGRTVAVSGIWAASLAPDRDGWGRGTLWQKYSGWIADDGLGRANDQSSNDLGFSLDVEGSIVALGVPNFVPHAWHGTGGVLSFEKVAGTWQRQEMLAPRQLSDDALFGCAVAMDGAYLAVGAEIDEIEGLTEQGSAWIFERDGDTWNGGQRLLASDAGSRNRFGYAIDISGSTMVVGAPEHYHEEPERLGGAYVFVKSGDVWTEQAELITTDSTWRYFGRAVAIEGDLIAVGEPFADWTGTDNGSVHLFERSGTTWAELQRLDSPEPGRDNMFGGELEFDQGRLFVAQNGINTNSELPGSIFVFEREGDTFVQTSAIRAPTPDVNDNFGARFDVEGDLLAVSHRNLDTGTFQVSLYQAEGDTWTYLNTLDHGEDHMLGGIAINGSALLLGTLNAGLPDPRAVDGAATYAGRAYVYDLCNTDSGCCFDSDCEAGEYCSAEHSCEPQRPLGEPCDAVTDCRAPGCAVCASGYCVDGVCCDFACEGACAACDGVLSVGEPGECSAAIADTVPTCDSSALCDGVSSECPGEGSGGIGGSDASSGGAGGSDASSGGASSGGAGGSSAGGSDADSGGTSGSAGAADGDVGGSNAGGSSAGGSGAGGSGAGGSGTDGGAGSDGGGGGGCGCRVSREAPGLTLWWGPLLALAVGYRRRGRAAVRRS